MAFSKDFIRRVSEATDILGLISSRGINLKMSTACDAGWVFGDVPNALIELS